MRPSARPIRQASLLLAIRLLHHDGGSPVDVVERQPRRHERLLPGRPFVASFPLRLDPLDGLGQLRLRGNELHPPGAAFIA